jgi:hypothetical protein
VLVPITEHLLLPTIAGLFVSARLACSSSSIDKLRPCVGKNKVLDLALSRVENDFGEGIRDLDVGKLLVRVETIQA